MSTLQPNQVAAESVVSELPVTLPVTIEQYSDLIECGHFQDAVGQIELINGRIVRMNPQGPEHADPLDVLAEWSVEQSQRRFRIRIEKPIVLPSTISSPEPDIAWVKRRSYAERHPNADDVLLVIEASVSSVAFDTGEKCVVYAVAGIPEYWQINVPRREIRVHRSPDAGSFRTITTHGMDETISPLCLPSATLPIAVLFETD